MTVLLPLRLRPQHQAQPGSNMNQVLDNLAVPSGIDLQCLPQADPIGDSTPTSPYSSLPGAIEDPSPIKLPPIRVSLAPPPSNIEHFSLHAGCSSS